MINMDIKTISSIKGLKVPKDLDALALNRLCVKMDGFVSTLPQNTYKWTRIFSVKDFEQLAVQFEGLSAFLNSIYAVPLADNCVKLLSCFTDGRRVSNQLDGLMQRFLTELMTLSIDIQTANYKPRGAAAQMQERSAVSVKEKKTILAVDDVPLLLRTLKSIIEDEQYSFHGLNSGKGALNYLQKHEPDLFILDIEMPDMNGYELMAKIREMGMVAPIIFLTGNSTREYVLKAIKLGADGFLAKPVERDLVRDKIKELLG